MRRLLHLSAFFLIAGPGHALVNIATVGDSLADSVYLGIKSQPQFMKKHEVSLTRWSRPSIGLTRIDFFDYPGWLRGSNTLGRADFCVVEMGANDVQSISVGQNKWVAAGSAEWQRRYTQRLEDMAATLKTQRCQEVVWLLQPAYQGNRFLNQHHAMMNSVQLSGLKSTSIQAFEIASAETDYQHDGIHFNGPFALKLGQAVVRLAESWRQFASGNCSDCHTSARYEEIAPEELSPLVLVR
jgi:hypothetical protein